MGREYDEDFEDYRKELCAQADYLGMESLTEDEQCIVNGLEFKENEQGNGI